MAAALPESRNDHPRLGDFQPDQVIEVQLSHLRQVAPGIFDLARR
ncbi:MULTISPECIES: hypothetical protein [Streptomyces]|nr:hypothetical protein [Streptomyces sp. b84]WTE27271.1 hypothetical protein OHB50_17360 [Streptomyces anulatus]